LYWLKDHDPLKLAILQKTNKKPQLTKQKMMDSFLLYWWMVDWTSTQSAARKGRGARFFTHFGIDELSDLLSSS